MNMWFKTAASVVSAAYVFSGFAAVEAPFEVGDWGNFCKGAISHTFDDNTAGQTSVAQPAFDEKGFHMTLFINTNGVSNWDKFKKAYAAGHEVASHNQNHDSNVSGLKPSQDAIRNGVPGEKCASIAYPNCNTPGDGEVLKLYIAGRNCDGQVAAKSPTNMAQISSKMFGAGSCNCPNDANSMNGFADQAAQKNGWAVTCHHGVTGDNHSWAVTSMDAIKSHLDYLNQNRGKIWCETFGNVARYIKERNAANIAVKSSDANGIIITVTDNLADDVFNYPLSIRRPLPDGWDTAVVTQNGKPVDDSIVTVDSKKYVMFKAIPDSGDVLISKGPISVAKRDSRFSVNANSSVAYKNSSLILNRNQLNGSDMVVTILNLNGRVLATYKVAKNQSSIALNEKITQSAFIVNITGNNRTITETFIPQM